MADLALAPLGKASLSLSARGFLGLYPYAGVLMGHDAFWELKRYEQGEFLQLEPEDLSLEAAEEEAGMLLFAGEPIREAIVHMAPFVMNTQDEIRQAINDYQSGRFGTLKAAMPDEAS